MTKNIPDLNGKDISVEMTDTTGKEEIAAGSDDMFESLPKEVTQIIDKLPPEEGKKVVESMQIMMGSFRAHSNSELTPVLKKLTETHIDKIIEYSEKDDERQFKFAMRSSFYVFLYVILGIGLFIFLTLYLAKDSSMIYMDIMKAIFAFLGGFGVGNYFGRKKS